MKNPRRPAFDATNGFIARKSFVYAGESYATGADFPFETNGCDDRKLRQLWDNGFLLPRGGEKGAHPVPTEVTDTQKRRKVKQV